MSGMEESLIDLENLLDAVEGSFIGDDENKKNFKFTSVATDSRNVVKGTLFVPLCGTMQDGHKYCPQAYDKGASVIFINEEEFKKNGNYYRELTQNDVNVSVIIVNNTLTALQKAAGRYVEKFPSLIKVCVTGSSGKTTSKEMIVSVLKQKYNVVYTQGNFNSETGLPLSVFNIRKEHEVGVFEMGMNRKNEIREISAVLKAKYALITNIGTAHIGILGSRKNIAEEKRHVFDWLGKDGTAFIPEMDDFADYLGEKVQGEIIRFGSFVPESKSGVKYLQDCGIAGTLFSIDGIEVQLKMAGIYNYANALGAVAIGKKLGLSAEQIKKGLESVAPVSGRMETEVIVIRTGKTITLIKDCYNANPDSMKNVLAFCHSLKNVKQMVYVLGDMLELGDKSQESHESVGAMVASDNPGMAIFVGTEMKYAYEKAFNRGFRNGFYVSKTDDEAIQQIADKILEKISDNDVLLIKASRGIALERIIPLIQKGGEE